MYSLNFCGTPGAAAAHPYQDLNPTMLDLRRQVAEQYRAYSAVGPPAHTFTMAAERLAGRGIYFFILKSQHRHRNMKQLEKRK